MKKKKKKQQTPKGAEISIPKRKDFMRDLRKVTKPKGESDGGSPKK